MGTRAMVCLFGEDQKLHESVIVPVCGDIFGTGKLIYETIRDHRLSPLPLYEAWEAVRDSLDAFEAGRRAFSGEMTRGDLMRNAISECCEYLYIVKPGDKEPSVEIYEYRHGLRFFYPVFDGNIADMAELFPRDEEQCEVYCEEDCPTP